jgi:hypothetical protein
VEWVKPIDEIEFDFRRHGSFLLVDTTGELKYYGRKTALNDRLVASMKGRGKEMVKFLIARARAKGEIT